MIAAIMQPYFFPYIGYFQLMKAVDVFVFYDDAQYMKGGWINRNRILKNGKPGWVTLPVHRASVTLAINQRHYLLDGDAVGQVQQKVRAAYGQAPYYHEAYSTLAELLEFKESNVARYNANLLTALARRLGIGCRFLTSSKIDKPDELRGEAKIIDLCHRIGASHYVNAIGGRDLYRPDSFRDAGMRLSFLHTQVSPEPLPSGPQHLSIIHSLMCHGLDRCRDRMTSYALLDQDAARAADSGSTA